MKTLSLRLFGISLFCILVLSCATANTMRNAPLYKGVLRTFKADHERVLKVAREAVVESGLFIEEVKQVDENTWMILSKKGVSVWSWGERVRVIVEKNTGDETKVRVYTKRKLATNITAKGDYSELILSKMEVKLR